MIVFAFFEDNPCDRVMEIVWSTWKKLEKYFVYFSMTSWKIRLWFRVFKFNSRCFSSDFKIFWPYFSVLMFYLPNTTGANITILILWTRYCFVSLKLLVKCLQLSISRRYQNSSVINTFLIYTSLLNLYG